MGGGRGTPPHATPPRDDDEDDDYVAEDDAIEVLELGDGEEENDDENEGEFEDMDEEPLLFEPPAVDDSDLTFSNHSKSVFCVGLDPTGCLAVSGGEDDLAFVWKVADGSVQMTCTGHSDSVVAAAFNHDGSMVATGDLAGLIKVWKVATGKEIWSFECTDLEWLEWHQVASVILAGTIDGSTWMWKIPSGECKTYAGPNCPASVGKLHPDGKRLSVGYGDGSLRIWDLKAADVVHSFSNLHSDNITCMSINNDGSLIVTGSVDGTVQLVNTISGKILSNLPCNGNVGNPSNDDEPDSVEAVALSASLPLAAAATLAGRLFLFDLNAAQLRLDPIQLSAGVTRLHFASNLLFVSCLDGTVVVLDTRTGSELKKWTGHCGQILDMTVASTGNFVLTASGDSTVKRFSMS